MKSWLHNVLRTHHKIMANFLRKRGWVVFYLEEEARHCMNGDCWLETYKADQRRTP